MISLGYDVTANYVMCAIQLLFLELANCREEWSSVCGRMGKDKKTVRKFGGKTSLKDQGRDERI